MQEDGTTTFLDWHTTGTPPHAHAVAHEITSIIEAFPEYFDLEKPIQNQAKQTLTILASNLKALPDIVESSTTTGKHRLLSHATLSPIYTALDPDPQFVECSAGKDSSPDDQLLERLGRLILLLHVTGVHALPAKVINSASLFCRNFTSALSISGKPVANPVDPSQNIYTDLQQFAKAHREAHDWRKIDHGFRQQANHATAPKALKQRHRDLHHICEELIAIDSGRSRPAPARDTTPDRTPTKQVETVRELIKSLMSKQRPLFKDRERVKRVKPVSPANPDDPAESSGYIIESDDAKLRKGLPEPGLEKLSVRGSQLRFSALWSGINVEALTAGEANGVMQWLTRYSPPDEAHHIARVLFILSGIFGHKFTNLLAGLGLQAPHDKPSPEITLTRHGNQIELNLAVMGRENFSKQHVEHPHLFDYVSQKLSLSIDLEGIVEQVELLDKISGITALDDPLLNAIIDAESELRLYIRQHICDRFAGHRWRAALSQSLCNATTDVPLAQLILGEDLGINISSQHYLARTTQHVADAHTAAIQQLFGKQWRSTPSPTANRLVGAGFAGIKIEVIQGVSHQLNENLSAAKQQDKQVAAHNILADRLGWLLMLSTASRNNKDFSEISLNQISLHACAIIYTDKPADPSIYRRLAALPPYVVGEIKRYIHHLVQLRDHCRRLKTGADLVEGITRRLDGTAPLLFQLRAQAEETATSQSGDTHQEVKWSARTLLNNYVAEKFPLNLCRHVFATHMRRQQLAPALMIEAQLGHPMGKPLFDTDSVISATEYTQYMAEPLDAYLQLCGIDTQTHYTPPAHLRFSHRNPKQAYTLVEDLQAENRHCQALVRKQQGLSPESEEEESCKVAIDEVLRGFQGISATEPYQRRVTIDQKACIELANAALSKIKGDETALVPGLKAFRIRLRELSDKYAWQVSYPPPIFWHINSPIELTKQHLQAYDLVHLLRNAITPPELQSTSPSGINEFTALVLVVFGYVSRFQTAWQLLSERRQPYFIDALGCWAIDIEIKKSKEEKPDADKPPRFKAISLPKTAMAILDYAFQQKEPVTIESVFYRDIAALLPNEWKQQRQGYKQALLATEKLVDLARMVDTPALINKAISHQLVQRELPAERLSQLFDRSGNNVACPLTPASDSTIPQQTKPRSPSEKAVRKELQSLLAIIPRQKPIDSSRPWRSARPKITTLLERDDLYPITTLCARWTLALMRKSANRRTGGLLAKSTIHDYVSTVGNLLTDTLGAVDVFSLDDEEILELIQTGLSKEPENRKSQCDRLNRFFEEVHELGNIPHLHFSANAAAHNAEASIDARVITPLEAKLAEQQLQQWGESTQLSTNGQSALREVSQYCALQAEVGARRNEIAFLRTKDYVPLDSLIAIRRTQNRSLKTSSAHRIIPISSVPTHSAQPSNDGQSDKLFPNLHNRRLGFQPLDIASMAIRHATGDSRARIHHFRHSVATMGMLDLFKIHDLMNRWTKGFQLATKLGHNSLNTTLSHYAHSAHAIYATCYTPSDTAMNAALLNVFSADAKSPRRLLKKSSKNVDKNLTTQSIHSPPFRKDLIEPLPQALHKTISTPADAIACFSALLRGNAQKDIAANALNASTYWALLQAILNIQQVTNFEAIPNTYLKSHLDAESAAEKNHETIRRNLPDKPFKQWIKNLSHHQNFVQVSSYAMVLESLSTGIQWKGKQVYCFCIPEKVEQLNDTIEALGIPVQCQQDAHTPNRVELTLDVGGTSSTSRTTVRSMLTLALALATI